MQSLIPFRWWPVGPRLPTGWPPIRSIRHFWLFNSSHRLEVTLSVYKIWAALAAVFICSAALGQGVQLPAGHMLGNSTAATRPARDEAVTLMLDRALGSTRGAILERSSTGWAIVSP